MPLTQINYTLNIVSRSQMREDVIRLFTQELPGQGTGVNASVYEYTVETYNNYKIILKRPAFLNKGFDFTVNISGLYFKKKKRYSYPTHQDIIDALTYCKNTNPAVYQTTIIPLINDIFNCKNINIGNTGMYFMDYNNQPHPIEIILLALKWLFIEQDFTYWNNSGRQMLYDGLKNSNLV